MRIRVLAVSVLSLALLWGCRGPVEGLVGEYEAEGQTGTKLVLHSDGGGVLTCADQAPLTREAPFHWEVKEGRSVVLYPRKGAPSVFTLSPHGLEGELPWGGRVFFRKK